MRYVIASLVIVAAFAVIGLEAYAYGPLVVAVTSGATASFVGLASVYVFLMGQGVLGWIMASQVAEAGFKVIGQLLLAGVNCTK